MALVIVATPGAADANSYATVSGANTYHEGRLNSDAWVDADADVKMAALVMAARYLDAIPGGWTGAASTETQALVWPRTGMASRNGFAIASGEIPQTLKDAQAEFARQLIVEDSTESDSVVSAGLSGLTAGPVSLKFREPMSQKDMSIPSNRAFARMIPDAVRALLVPSWLVDPREEEEVYTGIVMETL
jgi:hypothetical protein